ncbi:lantibiotic dehydratase family protein [Polaribacter sp. IC073]|uniref:lantibiotic dehydratase family protein n=1 Tax=Polaribacter sp. IC073 TaxID=2508540 RepID=UPI0011BE9849|nr:lantibiotic dehydratase family protein [Polaribacter sp. IC073]TXD49759.1 hypothetical protein ES045_00820 [Polaribacter sp. IC073]
MLKKKENKYQIFNSYCLRTPLLPFSKIKNIYNSTSIDFKILLESVVFREAIFLASPDLYNQIIKWEQGKLQDEQKIEKLKFSILKYFTRISSRCTPFGLFASCGVGEFGYETNIQLNNTNVYERHTRFDTTFLNQLSQELLKIDVIKENVLFYPNTSIYKIGNHYRYVEYSIENKRRNYALEGLVHSEYLEAILNEAKTGKTINELSKLLVDVEITNEEAKGFVEELIDNQILVSELEITVTGGDYFENLLYRIKQIPEASEIYFQLFDLEKALKKLDSKFGNSIKLYESIISLAKNLVPDLDTKYLFQTDTFTSFKENTLDENIKKQLKKVFVLFNKMTLPSSNGNIEQFKRDFLNRFEDSEEIPLNLVLDTETGLGYGFKKEDSNDLLDDIFSPKIIKRYKHFTWTDVDDILQQKLINTLLKGEHVLHLNEDDFKDLPLSWNDLPDTFSSLIEIYKVQDDVKVFIDNAGGTSATYLMGRFSANNNNKVNSFIKEVSDLEKKLNPNQILAEIVHLPESRIGNIINRSAIRNYEIPYLGNSSVPLKNQIPITDILVTIKNDKIILKSKKLDKEILTRLSNAHNYDSNSLPTYKFLCDIQTQDKRDVIGFGWNPIFKNYSFLPRVEFENMIFSKAKWKINVNKFKELFIEEKCTSLIRKWQIDNMIPDLVELVEGDNKLLINLKNDLSISILLNTVKNMKEFLLEEFLFSDNENIKDEKGNSFCNQFIVSYYNNTKL